MATEEEVAVLLRMIGTTQFIRDAELASGSIREVGVASEEAGLGMTHATRRGYLMNQAMFTMRRLLYGVTLATVGVGVAAIKMGFNFTSAMQQARVSLAPVSRSLGGVQNELDYLFNFTKYTPFQFKDVTIAFRQMFAALHPLGISVGTVNTTMHSLVDALAYAGKTSPTNLQRVSLALQHMAYQGRLTGYAVNQLARDGVPIFQALRKELGLTGDQLHTVASLGIPANVVLQALNKYIESTPGFANAAYRQATGSLHGLFTTFKDNLSQLMGNLESGVFARTQRRLVAFNAFFGRIADQMRHKSSFASIVGDALGGTAEFVWRQFAADIALAWHIFTGFIADVAKSKGFWFTVTSALVLLHGILLPVNFAVQHFGGLLTVLIPLLAAWKVYIITMNALLSLQKWLIAADEGELGALSLGQLLYNNAIRGYIILINGWAAARSALNVLLTGTALGNEYRALTLLERVALSIRGAFIRLFAPLAAIVAESWAFTASLLANPITWIVLGVVALVAGLTILYLKWAPFRKLVNDTFGWLWRHPMVALFVPVIGPLIAIAKAFEAIYHNLNGIYGLLRHPLGTLGGHGKFGWRSLLNDAFNPLSAFGTFGIHVPGLATGGTITSTGRVLVGEQGPELLSLPAGATVQPLGIGAANGAVGDSGPVGPLTIQFVVGQRVLEQAIVDIMQGRVATA